VQAALNKKLELLTCASLIIMRVTRTLTFHYITNLTTSYSDTLLQLIVFLSAPGQQWLTGYVIPGDFSADATIPGCNT